MKRYVFAPTTAEGVIAVSGGKMRNRLELPDGESWPSGLRRGDFVMVEGLRLNLPQFVARVEAAEGPTLALDPRFSPLVFEVADGPVRVWNSGSAA